MYNTLLDFIISILGIQTISKILTFIIFIIIFIAIAFVVDLLTMTAAGITSKKAKTNTFRTAATGFNKRHMPKKIATFSFFLLLGYLAEAIPNKATLFGRLSVIGMIICSIVIFNTALDIVNDIYCLRPVSKKRPIKGPLQVVKIVIALIFSIIIISVLLNQNPIVLISGIGAFTAILSIVFKDALLGLVAGVQITSENLLQIGDWISIPSTGVEGTVTDIALISVKVTAFDNTVYTVPAYTFLSTPFKNWHSTLAQGKRMAHLNINVDANTVQADGDVTNLTKYRTDLMEALKSDPNILDKTTLQCKTSGSPSGAGIPLDVYFYCDVTDYDEYCEFVTLKYEKAISSLGKYGLKPYQSSKQSMN